MGKKQVKKGKEIKNVKKDDAMSLFSKELNQHDSCKTHKPSKKS